MKKLFSILLIVFSCLSYMLNAQDTISHRPGEILVMLQSSGNAENCLKRIAADYQVTLSIKQCISKRSNIWLFGFDESINAEQDVLNALRASGLTVAAQFNHYISQRGVPDDTQFANQYALNNTGQGGGTPDADIDAVEAWDITTGDLSAQGDTIVVAVIDAGFQLTHPDLDFWKNYNEIAGNGIDDDGNGFVDDVNGWNVFTHNGNIVNNQHGTHVAGIVGARGNNSLGVSGVNWNVKLMPVVGATTVESEAMEAYSYVLECRRLYNESNGTKGAFVVATNSSFGVDHGQPVNFPIWCAYYDSLGSVGILSAAATANANWNIDVAYDIPCSCPSPHLIGVSSTDRNDNKVSSSGYGVQTIDLAAPGASVYSTYPTSTYNTMTGTSMASPHVAGAVALMYAAACDSIISAYKMFPDSISIEMKNIMLNAVDQKIGFDTLYASGGRLNVFNAVVGVQQFGNCFTNSISEMNGDVIQVFPNPSSDWVSISLTEEIERVDVQDIQGRKIISKAGDHSKELGVEISVLNSGVYFLNVIDCNGKRWIKKLVKTD